MKYFIATALCISINTSASESKIICGHDKGTSPNLLTVIGDTEGKALNDINAKIKLAEAEGFVRVSAPMSVNSNGYTYSFCVTVTKP